MKDIQDKLREYGAKLDDLQKKCAEAEKDAIIAETNLQNCIQQRDLLIGELETFTNCTFDEIPALLQHEEAELDAIMEKLMQVNLSDSPSHETLAQLKNIVSTFGIQIPAI